MRRLILAFWVAVVAATGPAVADAGPPAAWKDAQFEKYATEVAESEDVVGLAAAVVRDGEPVLIRSWGLREVGGSDPVDLHTIFRLASLSKAFSTGLAAQLVAEGKLELDATAISYAPEFRLKDRKQLAAVTLEHVMSHRLGLPPNAYDNLLENGLPPAQILHRLNQVKPICRVGECYGYQNVGFNILAGAIESADGRTFDEAMAERLFKPLHMETASVGPEGLRKTGNWARPHRRGKGKPWHLTRVKETYYRLPAAAGVNASITDMANWLAAQMGDAPEVLSPEMLSMLHKPRVSTPSQIRRIGQFLNVKSAEYGLGWRVYDIGGETVISHTGSVDGYSAQITFIPARKVGIVLLCNSRSRTFYKIMPFWLMLELGPKAARPAPTGKAG